MQELGEQLIDLTPEQLAGIDLDDALLSAVSAAKTIKSHGALRRQKQLIGKLMRNIDPDPVRQALERFGRQDRAEKAAFRRAEVWRDRIVSEGEAALQEFYAETGETSAALSALLHELQTTEFESGKRHIRRRLFRLVRLQLTDGVQTAASESSD